jgi:hypothetical protein
MFPPYIFAERAAPAAVFITELKLVHPAKFAPAAALKLI